MLITLVLLVASAAVIYLACEFFVNGVEWVGRKAGVAQKAVGTILAAFGTALPESVVTFVAVVFGQSEASKSIGVGAALGGPLVLSTISYAVVGLMLLNTTGRMRPATLVDRDGRLSRDQGWFLLIFILKVGLGLIAFAIKPWLGWAMRRLGTSVFGGAFPVRHAGRRADRSGVVCGRYAALADSR